MSGTDPVMLGGSGEIRTRDQRIMRADIQRKPLGFQELTSPKYRCVSIYVTDLTREEETLAHSLAFKTKEILEQPSSTSLLQTVCQVNERYLK